MITLMLLPALVGLVIIARPGVALRMVRLRGAWLIVIAAVLQFAQVNNWWPSQISVSTERRVYAVLVVVLATAFCWLNRSLAHRPTGKLAVTFIPLGAALNSLPIAVLGGMPVSVPAALVAGYSPAEMDPVIPGYVRLDDVSRLWTPLADLIPVPVLMKVMSLGDLVLFTGLALLIVALGMPQRTAQQALPIAHDSEMSIDVSHSEGR